MEDVVSQLTENYPPKISEDRKAMEPDSTLVNRCLLCLRPGDARRMRGVLNKYVLGWAVVNDSKNPGGHPWVPQLDDLKKQILIYIDWNE